MREVGPLQTGLLAAWPASSGVYADATNQPNRYTVLNGVVTDTLTNIQWEQTAGTGTMGWSSVSSYCAARTTGGMTDWRVPNIVELGTLVDYTASSPYINTTAFPGAPASNFWSASVDIGNSGKSWYLNVASYYGASWYQAPGIASPVRCVRSSYPLPPSSRYTVGTGTSTGTVTDHVTGFIWQKVSPGTYTQSGAVNYCTTLNLGGLSSGWRLPTVRELQTLVDYSATYNTLMMNTTVFSGEPVNWFWSSTPVSGPAYAWFVHFDVGNVDYNVLGLPYYVRCVR